MLAGQDAEALAVSLLHADLLYVGLNCATGPELMTRPPAHALRARRARASPACPTPACPTRTGRYHEGPEQFRRGASAASSTPAGSTWSAAAAAPPAAHVAALAELVAGPPRRGRSRTTSARWSPGLEAVELDRRQPAAPRRRAHQRPRQPQVQGADRGRRATRRAAEVGRAQVRGGAQVLDVCLQDPDRDEIADVEALPRPADRAWSRCR